MPTPGYEEQQRHQSRDGNDEDMQGLGEVMTDNAVEQRFAHQAYLHAIPLGAIGVSMHVLAAMQLTGCAGDMQIPNARLAGVFNMGGSGVANYVSILEPLRG